MADKVLIISYYFPPLGGAGIGRPLNLLKYLPQHDVEVEVLTVKNVAYRYYDKKLLKEIEPYKIFRSSSWDPQRLMYLMGMRTIKDKTISKSANVSGRFFPDSKIGWVKPAVKLGRVLLENRNYKAIITTSPPISTHLIGLKLSKEYQIPWVADFRDYWTSYKIDDWYETASQQDKAKALLEKIKKKASVVTSVSQKIADYLGTSNIIHNSFDEERSKLWQYKPNEKFVVGLMGTFDSLCPLEPLFKSLSYLRDTKSALYDKIELMQVGSINQIEMDSLIDQYDLRDKIVLNGYQNREDTIKLLESASLFYLGLNPHYAEGILTSRLFDIIASGRQIIASVPEGCELEQFITSNGFGYTYDKQNEKKAVEYLSSAIESFEKGTWVVTPRNEKAKEYSSVMMAGEFAELIKKL